MTIIVMLIKHSFLKLTEILVDDELNVIIQFLYQFGENYFFHGGGEMLTKNRRQLVVILLDQCLHRFKYTAVSQCCVMWKEGNNNKIQGDLDDAREMPSALIFRENQVEQIFAFL